MSETTLRAKEASTTKLESPPFREGRRTGLLPHYHRVASQHPAHPVGLLQAVQSLLKVLIVALFLMTFTVQPIRIPSVSMEPTLLVGDFLLLDKQATAQASPWYMPHVGLARGDVVVFHDPVDDPSIHLIKRIEGIPGDRIRLRDGRLFRNGSPVREDYVIFHPRAPDAYRDDFPNLHVIDPQVNLEWWIKLQSLTRNGEITVPDGSYFVMGDNRNDSEDSRYWGFVPRDAMVGKPILIYFSWRDDVRVDGSKETIVPGEMQSTEAGLAPASTTRLVRWDRIFQRIR